MSTRRSNRSSTKKHQYGAVAISDRAIMKQRKSGVVNTKQLSDESDVDYLTYLNNAAKKSGRFGKITRSSIKAKENAKKAKAKKSVKAARTIVLPDNLPIKNALTPVSSAPEPDSPDKELAEQDFGTGYGTPSLLNQDGMVFSPAIAANNDNEPLPSPTSSSSSSSSVAPVALTSQRMERNVQAARAQLKVVGIKITHAVSKAMDNPTELEKYPLDLILSAM